MEGKEFIYKCKNIRLQQYCFHGKTVIISYCLCHPNASGQSFEQMQAKENNQKASCLQMEVELDKLCETLKEFLRVDSRF